VPALPVSLLEPRWAQVSVLLPDHPEMSASPPLGCHRRHVPDRVMVDHVVTVVVYASAPSGSPPWTLPIPRSVVDCESASPGGPKATT
jgi:hypothetical protein